MASIWTLNGNDIYVDQFSENALAQIAELNPIGSTASVFHALFEPTDTFTIQGVVIGEAFKDGIKSTKGSIVSLITDLVPAGFNVLVIDVRAERTIAFKQTVDDTQPDTAPVFRLSITVRPD